MEYLVFLSFFLALLLVFTFFKIYIIKRFEKLAQKTKVKIDETLVKIITRIRFSFYAYLSFYFASAYLNISELAQNVLDGVLIAFVAYYLVIGARILIDYFFFGYIARGKDPGTKQALDNVAKIIKAMLWVFALLLVVSNFGVNITPLIAGLGIGGLAIAIALQNILSDLFSSFAIFFDKPFIVGDFIIVGKDMGVVEKVGIKTTRIRALGGEELIISNRELTSTRVQNFKRMKERRISFSFGVVYKASSEKLKKIPSIIEKIISNTEDARFDRAHFNKFGESSLVFEAVYFVLLPDYVKFMDVHQKILFRIKEEFEKEGIEMAFPTQTIYLEKQA